MIFISFYNNNRFSRLVTNPVLKRVFVLVTFVVLCAIQFTNPCPQSPGEEDSSTILAGQLADATR